MIKVSILIAAISKTDRAMQIAALGYFHQSSAGPLGMTGTKAAIIRAALPYCFPGTAAKGNFGPDPGGKIWLTAPDHSFKLTMVRAGFDHGHHIPSTLQDGFNTL
jgi:hypothetical protein